MEIRTVQVNRYVTALREGGSLPAIAEADDGFLYAVKFRGAGQGIRALIAELIGAELAAAIGLKVPEFVFAILDEAFGRIEPDEEIQDLLKASIGLNMGMHYLSGAISYDPAVHITDGITAAKIVWLDSFLMNMDRSYRNTNMLMWQKELWLIDHGAALYFHHNWPGWEQKATSKFPLIKDHVLLPLAKDFLSEVNVEIQKKMTKSLINEIIEGIPEDWLKDETYFKSIEEHRLAYKTFLQNRLLHAEEFIKEAQHAG